jgi:hypothetical protein
VGDELKTIFKAAFTLLGIMTAVAVVADRFLDNPGQASGRDHKT